MIDTGQSEVVESLRTRLYAALKHEKSCTCGECAGGLNALDELVQLAISASEGREVDRRILTGFRDAAEDRADRLQEAIEELEARPLLDLIDEQPLSDLPVIAKAVLDSIVASAERGAAAVVEQDRLREVLMNIADGDVPSMRNHLGWVEPHERYELAAQAALDATPPEFMPEDEGE